MAMNPEKFGKRAIRRGLDELVQDPTNIESIPTPPASASTNPTKQKKEKKLSTVQIDSNILNVLKSIAYWECMPIKRVVEEALNKYIANYEEEKGPIKEAPKGKKFRIITYDNP
jgi:hypothetical protein